jgi:prepilin-type N-terminal cleavage/methylation domain-containing protein
MMMKSRGFSLIELMIVVAVVGILAAVAIPYFGRQRKKAYTSEVPGMFAAIKVSQAAYKAEYGLYLSTGASEASIYPALLGSGEPKLKTWAPATTSNWSILGVQPPDYSLYCGYVTIAGSAGVAPPTANGVKIFGGKTPQKSYFYVIAQCDTDGKPSINTLMISSSERERLITLNSGD